MINEQKKCHEITNIKFCSPTNTWLHPPMTTISWMLPKSLAGAKSLGMPKTQTLDLGIWPAITLGFI